MREATRKSGARVGDSVVVEAVPPDVNRTPSLARRVFRRAVGHQFKVRGRNRIGWLELHVRRAGNERSYKHFIWIDPEYVRVVRRGARRA